MRHYTSSQASKDMAVNHIRQDVGVLQNPATHRFLLNILPIDFDTKCCRFKDTALGREYCPRCTYLIKCKEEEA